MTDDAAELLDELRAKLARTEGELFATREQVAGSAATETQLRGELDAAKAQAVSAEAEVAHAQRLSEERLLGLRGQMARLTEELDEERCARRQAEQERAAVIAALGHRARRRLRGAD